jgi:hypothetical protein
MEPPAPGALHDTAARWLPKEPERPAARLSEDLPSEPPARALHDTAARWLPNEPEPGAARLEYLPMELTASNAPH